ncbi:MAG: O-antigen ligase family protein [Acidobacteria bacterium]|nr:O-antigen ligase family protein [Acidobacteriota bacterium]
MPISESAQSTQPRWVGDASEQGAPKWLSRAVESGVWLLLLLTPLALGSVKERDTALMEGACFTLLIVAWWGGLKREGFKFPAWIGWPAFFFVLWTLFQVVPLPPQALRILSPGTYAAYSKYLPGYSTGESRVDVQSWLLQRHGTPSETLAPRTGEQTGMEGKLFVQPGWQPVSWYPWETLRWLSRLLAYGAFFLLVAGFLPERALEKRLPWLIVASGFTLSLFGIVQYLTWNEKIFWVIPVYQGHPFGPWVNSNHFAGYVEMALLLGCGLFLKEAGFGPRRRRPHDFLRRAAPKLALHLFMLILMSGAIALANSRGGMFSLALTSGVYFWLQVARAESGKPRRIAWKALAVVPLLLCVAGMAYYILKGSEIQVEETGMEASFSGRIKAWKGVLPMIAANPLSGTGLGAFSLSYPLHKMYGDTMIWDQAHNEYLQVLAESGLIGFALFLWGLVSFWRMGLSPRLSNGWRLQPSVSLGASLGVVALLFHSLVDFNLQIPSNGLLFVLLGALVVVGKDTMGKERKSSRPEQTTSPGDSRKSLSDAVLTLQGVSESRILIPPPRRIPRWIGP